MTQRSSPAVYAEAVRPRIVALRAAAVAAGNVAVRTGDRRPLAPAAAQARQLLGRMPAPPAVEPCRTAHGWLTHGLEAIAEGRPSMGRLLLDHGLRALPHNGNVPAGAAR